MQPLHKSDHPGRGRIPCGMVAVATSALSRPPRLKATLTRRTSDRVGHAAPRAHGSYNPDSQSVQQQSGTPSSQTAQQSGMYYSSNPPQKPAVPAPSQTGRAFPTALPQQQQHHHRQQPYQGQPLFRTQANQAGYQYQPVGQGVPTSPSDHVHDSYASGGLSRVNPGKASINSVTLLGIVLQPQLQGRCAQATMQVPFATKPGNQEFLLEAWDSEASELMGLHGIKVLVEGRLSRDNTSGGVKVVAYRIKLVDETLPPMQSRQVDGSRVQAARIQLDPQEVWRTHYETQSQTIKGLASQFACTASTVQKVLLQHAFKSQSPLHWRALSEEAGLGSAGGSEALTLADFMAVVAEYQKDVAAMHAAAHPEATSSPLPVTKEGMLKVKPIRDWALGKGEHNMNYYIVATYEARYGEAALYDTLRLAVVAEATQGAWDYEAEFDGQP